MDIQGAQQSLLSLLTSLYPDREAAVITDWVLENITGRKKIDRLINKNTPLTAGESELFHRYSAELRTHRPVQYVLHESWFAGMNFYVDEQVLIPRPETEELVEWVADTSQPHPSILDIGTGSGCIAITLTKRLPGARVHACDISEGALSIAKRNAASLGSDIHFLHLDILDPGQRAALPPFDVLVSNPPYIPMKDKTAMSPGVLDWEPHGALFVTDDDPLVFYRAIAGLAREKLLPGGSVFGEIHEDLATRVTALFRESGFREIIIRKDMQGKDRMISATR